MGSRSETSTIGDFTIYDENCATNEGVEDINKRSKSVIDVELSIIPNPNDGNFKIISADNSPKKIELMDTQGRILKTFIIQKQTNAVDFEGLVAGLYYIRCTFKSNDIVIRKVIVY